MVEPIDARLVEASLGEYTGSLYDMQNRDAPGGSRNAASRAETAVPGALLVLNGWNMDQAG